jgi:hypothetical protein
MNLINTGILMQRYLVYINFYFNLEAGNDGYMECYRSLDGGSTYTLESTLNFDGASYQFICSESDLFYAKIYQTARADISQRGQIQTFENGTTLIDNVTTTAGGLPKSVSSTVQSVIYGKTYDVYGHCGYVI